MSCNHCATASAGPAKQAGAPEIEAAWAGNRGAGLRCQTCGRFVSPDGGHNCPEWHLFSRKIQSLNLVKRGSPDKHYYTHPSDGGEATLTGNFVEALRGVYFGPFDDQTQADHIFDMVVKGWGSESAAVAALASGTEGKQAWEYFPIHSDVVAVENQRARIKAGVDAKPGDLSGPENEYTPPFTDKELWAKLEELGITAVNVGKHGEYEKSPLWGVPSKSGGVVSLIGFSADEANKEGPSLSGYLLNEISPEQATALFKRAYSSMSPEHKPRVKALQKYIDQKLRAARRGLSIKPGADLRLAHLVGVPLQEADLSGSNLVDANLSRADLSQANLTGADLRHTRFLSARLCRANLNVVNGQFAKLDGADLSEADLQNADLTSASFTAADLTAANLGWANLQEADLRRANLSWANLQNTDLRGADLTGSILIGTKMDGAVFDKQTKWAEGFYPPATTRVIG